MAPAFAPSGRSGPIEPRGSQEAVDVPLLAGGGLAGGAVGLFGGGVLGYTLSGGGRICGDDSCGLLGGVYGAAMGEVVLLPLGVHLANRARGNYGYSLLASAAVGAIGVGLAGATNSTELLLAVPIGQLISSVLIERATSRPKEAASRAAPGEGTSLMVRSSNTDP